MPELTQTEKLTIAAVVDGMQARTRSRRKAARQGWALLVTGALAMPISTVGAAQNMVISSSRISL